MNSPEPYLSNPLAVTESFRVAELLPGTGDDPIRCDIHTVHWDQGQQYEALSYAWGDPNQLAPVYCNSERIRVTKTLHLALQHLRYRDRSRILWADALCINQSDIPERGQQVRQMKKIFESSVAVVIWLGSGEEGMAERAIRDLTRLSNYVCEVIGVSLSDLSGVENVRDLVFANRSRLLVPNECPIQDEIQWENLVWLYSHPYFTRVWVIQELSAHSKRIVYCGHQITEWDRVELIAGYIIMETAFAKGYGFSKTYCWWASTVGGSLSSKSRRKNWLRLLYLASNFEATDPRDVLYGLIGIMDLPADSPLLAPDYSKTIIDVYRDSVETALTTFKNTDSLLYVSNPQAPSWIPRWNEAMLFRNPFRFGPNLPWRPAGDTVPLWSIDKNKNELELSGFLVDSIASSIAYHESFFGNAMIRSESDRPTLQRFWGGVLESLHKRETRAADDERNQERQERESRPLDRATLTKAAVALSYGLNEKSEPADHEVLLRTCVVCAKLALDPSVFREYISEDTAEWAERSGGDGEAFGKPVWDFEYPESSFFVTDTGLVGSCIAPTEPGDLVFVPLGSTFPVVLRPAHAADIGSDDVNDTSSGRYLLKGYSYVDGVMHGEKKDLSRRTVTII